MTSVPESAFDVLDLLGGLCRLTRRSPTLDGAVPLRVAQGCVPLLEGNAYGFQVELTKPLRVTRRLGRLAAAFPPEVSRDLAHRLLGNRPRLAAEGVPHDAGALARIGPSPVSLRSGVVRLFTGLLVRPREGLALRATAAANRRGTSFAVAEQLWSDSERFVPLVLDVRPDVARGELLLLGEIASLAPVQPGLTVAEVSVADARDVLASHAAFYDAAYFAGKKAGAVTGKYRKLTHRLSGSEDGVGAVARLVAVPGAGVTVERAPRGGVTTLLVSSTVSFTASYDGLNLVVEPDVSALEKQAATIRASLKGLVDDGGALLYLTKLFTPHPPGEPHFFVKPPAFLATPPGWSTLLDGLHGPGYDVLRGVVATDVFHALPAVFRLHGDGVRIAVTAGTPLLRLVPFPRALLERPFAALDLLDL